MRTRIWRRPGPDCSLVLWCTCVMWTVALFCCSVERRWRCCKLFKCFVFPLFFTMERYAQQKNDRRVKEECNGCLTVIATPPLHYGVAVFAVRRRSPNPFKTVKVRCKLYCNIICLICICQTMRTPAETRCRSLAVCERESLVLSDRSTASCNNHNTHRSRQPTTTAFRFRVHIQYQTALLTILVLLIWYNVVFEPIQGDTVAIYGSRWHGS
jgi:hypothetical protein